MHLIRAASVADASIIADLAERTWWPAYGGLLEPAQIAYMLEHIYAPDKISAQIGSGTQAYLILEEDGVPVAFAASSPRDEDPMIYKLHKLYCLPQTQRKGYGRLLIDAVGDVARAAGVRLLELNVNRSNKARTFYEKNGFRIAYQEDIPIGPYWMNDYVMRKEL